MADTNALVEQISGLTLLETAELIKALESKLGVSAAAPVAAAAPAAGGGGAAAAAPAEEKTSFDVILTEMGANKIGVIKEVARGRQRPGSGGSQGPRRRCPEADQGRHPQGRGRGDQEEDRSRRREGHDQIIQPAGASPLRVEPDRPSGIPAGRFLFCPGHRRFGKSVCRAVTVETLAGQPHVGYRSCRCFPTSADRGGRCCCPSLSARSSCAASGFGAPTLSFPPPRLPRPSSTV